MNSKQKQSFKPGLEEEPLNKENDRRRTDPSQRLSWSGGFDWLSCSNCSCKFLIYSQLFFVTRTANQLVKQRQHPTYCRRCGATRSWGTLWLRMVGTRATSRFKTLLWFYFLLSTGKSWVIETSQYTQQGLHNIFIPFYFLIAHTPYVSGCRVLSALEAERALVACQRSLWISVVFILIFTTKVALNIGFFNLMLFSKSVLHKNTLKA